MDLHCDKCKQFYDEICIIIKHNQFLRDRHPNPNVRFDFSKLMKNFGSSTIHGKELERINKILLDENRDLKKEIDRLKAENDVF